MLAFVGLALQANLMTFTYLNPSLAGLAPTGGVWELVLWEIALQANVTSPERDLLHKKQMRQSVARHCVTSRLSK